MQNFYFDQHLNPKYVVAKPKALNTMPFTRMKEDDCRYRIWSVENKKCLVLKKDRSFTFSGEKSVDGSSEVKATRKKSGSKFNAWHLQFRTGGKKYVLDIDVDNDTGVSAREFGDDEPPEDAAGFVPVKKEAGPFEALKLESHGNKFLAFNKEDQKLTINESPSILVICDADM